MSTNIQDFKGIKNRKRVDLLDLQFYGVKGKVDMCIDYPKSAFVTYVKTINFFFFSEKNF